ncbi:MAG: Response regulator receiver protein [Chthoniobacteraceae bacterium]|nr:Response regulator receiver protein [Chthoniobacteraceae bacterium]
MSQPEPFSDFENRPKKRVNDLSPIINLPVNAMIDEVDPTRDIRSLIDELQRAARESREQTQLSERENERLTVKLETALAELRAAGTREAELRSRFLEVTSLIKERDAARAAEERSMQTIAELQKRLEAVTRENDALSRQRELAVRQLDALTKSAAATAAQLVQAQTQIVSIRQARDAIQAQSRETADKLARAEDQLAEFVYEKEHSQNHADQAVEKIADLHRQVEALAAERAALVEQVSALSREVDAGRQKILDLSEQRSAAAMAGNEHSATLSDARAQILESARERDLERARVDELNNELHALRIKFDALQADYVEAYNAKAELEEARRQLQLIPMQKEALAEREKELLSQSQEQEEQLAQFAAQLASAQDGRESVLETMAAAEARIEEIHRERADAEERQAEQTRALELQTAALTERDAELVQSLARAREEQSAQNQKLHELNRQCEDHRLVAIELAGRLDAAQRELIEVTANLAEARLQVKSAKRKRAAPVASSLPERSDEPDVSNPIDVYPPLTEKDSRSVLVAMRQCHQAFTKSPSDLSLINELYCHAHSFSERARTSGMLALHRLGSAFASLTHHLYEIPESLNVSTMNTMQQTIELLMTLARDRNLMRLMDPTKAQVYAVDDDVDGCEIISLGLEMVMLKPVYSAEPFAALADLSNGAYDLIFLDVDLPGMDGFELCSEIRKLDTYGKTPIVFLTGLDTPDYKARATEHGGTDFIAKPFNLHELGVKALTHLLKSQLEAAG